MNYPRMLGSADRAMLSRLLEVFILFCCVTLTPANSEDNENSTTDPAPPLLQHNWYGDGEKWNNMNMLRLTNVENISRIDDPHTIRFNSSEGPMNETFEESWQPQPRSAVNMWPPTGNWTNGNPDLRMVGDPLMPPPSVNICSMLMNAAIPPPASQVPYHCICEYCKKSTGRKGDRGDRGPPGITGSPGYRGMTGFKGDQGFTGIRGIKGQKGDMGNQGLPGMTGFIGSKGERGFKGDKGDQGSMGNPGAIGPQGEKGICPASCWSAPGSPGPQGPPGTSGGRGLPGAQGPVGSKGMKGDKGDLGRPGDPGVMGEKGHQGEQGLCQCTDGMNGNDGEPGAKGDKGGKGDTGAQGEQGPIGMKGMNGDMGFMGPPGPCSPAIQSAFSASLGESFPKSDWPVAFPIVITNRQGHFNPSMGMYTAPVNGTFVFSFHLTVSVKPLKVGLFHNFEPVFKSTEIQNPTTTSQKAVLHLQRGDQVWLQVKSNDTNGMFVDVESSSMFSGFLLYPDTCEFPLGRDFVSPTQFTSRTFTWGDDQPMFTTPPK